MELAQRGVGPAFRTDQYQVAAYRADSRPADLVKQIVAFYATADDFIRAAIAILLVVVFAGFCMVSFVRGKVRFHGDPLVEGEIQAFEVAGVPVFFQIPMDSSRQLVDVLDPPSL